MVNRSTASELRHVEQLIMKWPRAIRLQLAAQDLRKRLAREQEAAARALRGEIRKRLMAADQDALARALRELGAAS